MRVIPDIRRKAKVTLLSSFFIQQLSPTNFARLSLNMLSVQKKGLSLFGKLRSASYQTSEREQRSLLLADLSCMSVDR